MLHRVLARICCNSLELLLSPTTNIKKKSEKRKSQRQNGWAGAVIVGRGGNGGQGQVVVDRGGN